jgi:hypothetical protein
MAQVGHQNGSDRLPVMAARCHHHHCHSLPVSVVGAKETVPAAAARSTQLCSWFPIVLLRARAHPSRHDIHRVLLPLSTPRRKLRFARRARLAPARAPCGVVPLRRGRPRTPRYLGVRWGWGGGGGGCVGTHAMLNACCAFQHETPCEGRVCVAVGSAGESLPALGSPPGPGYLAELPVPSQGVCPEHAAAVAARGFVCLVCRCGLSSKDLAAYNAALAAGMHALSAASTTGGRPSHSASKLRWAPLAMFACCAAEQLPGLGAAGCCPRGPCTPQGYPVAIVVCIVQGCRVQCVATPAGRH